MNSDRYNKALNRTLAELQKCLLIKITILGLAQYEFSSNIFIRVIDISLYDDYISRAIKIFDRNSKSASFWYIWKCTPTPIEKFAKSENFDIQNLDIVTRKLKLIRNGSHFHIDEDGVKNPEKIWSDAGLAGKELTDALDFVWKALRVIQISKGGDVPLIPNHYTAEFVSENLVRIDTNCYS
jgi:hypothetical protein